MDPFIEKIKKRLEAGLPGSEAQLRMAPPLRAKHLEPAADARLGAVMILLFKDENQWSTLLIRRTEDGNVHSGQIGFPGGKIEASDPDEISAACRECEEEIGIGKSAVEIVGCLTPLYIPPSNFFVTPVLGILEQPFDLIVSEIEVQEVIRISLHDLFDHKIKGKKMITTALNQQWETPVYAIHSDYFVWGATAMMIAELEDLLTPLSTI